MKKLLALLLAVCMVASLFAGCKKNTTKPTDAPTDGATDAPTEAPTEDTTPKTFEDYVDPVKDMDYNEQSSFLYNEALGEFNELYTAAQEADDVDLKFALEAQAEAKLLSSAMMLPLSTKGGNYAISRVAPHTAPYVKWGNDYERYHNVLVVDSEKPILASEREEMKAKWTELKGTGTWYQWAKDYLTGKGYTLKDTYTMGYTSDPQTWDALATSMAADSEAIINTYDGLYEYDTEGTLQPALAESSEVSDDGLTVTFHLRQGLTWVDSQGRKVADLTADDFVAGMQHMLDAAGGLEYLVDGVIVNASEYINGDITDFEQVGVKATDDHTLVYTLVAPCSYFMTMLGYGVFAPMNRDYFLSQGGAFGVDDYAAAKESGSYVYGTTPNNIAYCGPYIVTNATAENTIVFSANESYWNKDNISIHTLTWLFNDRQDATKGYNDAKDGILDGAGMNSAGVTACKADGLFDDYAYSADTDATSYMAFYNINRQMFHNFNDETMAVSTQDPEYDGVRTNAAMRNVNFRRAISLGVDRASYNAQDVGEDLKLVSLRNTYVPGDFVFLSKETTVSVNGTDVTYPAGTAYGKILQDQLDADGFPIKAFDEATLSSDGFDGWYNPEAAKAYLETAITELAAEGIIIDAENPIYIDVPTFTGSETFKNKEAVYKKCLEEMSDGKIIVNLVECPASKDWLNAGYYPTTGAEGNFNMYDGSGWGPDFGDPKTYLDTLLPDGAGYMTKVMGMF